MKALQENEVSMVSGGAAGAITALVVLAFVYKERNNIRDFFEGVYEGYDKNQEKHRQAEGASP